MNSMTKQSKPQRVTIGPVAPDRMNFLMEESDRENYLKILAANPLATPTTIGRMALKVAAGLINGGAR